MHYARDGTGGGGGGGGAQTQWWTRNCKNATGWYGEPMAEIVRRCMPAEVESVMLDGEMMVERREAPLAKERRRLLAELVNGPRHPIARRVLVAFAIPSREGDRRVGEHRELVAREKSVRQLVLEVVVVPHVLLYEHRREHH